MTTSRVFLVGTGIALGLALCSCQSRKYVLTSEPLVPAGKNVNPPGARPMTAEQMAASKERAAQRAVEVAAQSRARTNLRR